VADPDEQYATKPTYFDEAFFSGKALTVDEAKNKYGGIVPIIALYKINWSLYEATYPNR
jgi:hypothetical protein